MTQTHNRTRVQEITQRECRETLGQVRNINSSWGKAIGRTGLRKAGEMMRHSTVLCSCTVACVVIMYSKALFL